MDYSTIDPTKPIVATPTTQSVRDNFLSAKSHADTIVAYLKSITSEPFAGYTRTGPQSFVPIADALNFNLLTIPADDNLTILELSTSPFNAGTPVPIEARRVTLKFDAQLYARAVSVARTLQITFFADFEQLHVLFSTTCSFWERTGIPAGSVLAAFHVTVDLPLDVSENFQTLYCKATDTGQTINQAILKNWQCLGFSISNTPL
jgi:hypothetical protein